MVPSGGDSGSVSSMEEEYQDEVSPRIEVPQEQPFPRIAVPQNILQNAPLPIREIEEMTAELRQFRAEQAGLRTPPTIQQQINPYND